MAAQEIILAIVAIRESARLMEGIASLFQSFSGVTDEQLAKAKADADATHNELQDTP